MPVRWLAGALGERNFRLLVSARAISFLGTNLAPIAVAFAVLDLTGSATDVGFAFAAWTLAQISTLLVGGVVSDRFSRRRVMVFSDSANFAIRIVMGVCCSQEAIDVWALVGLQALGGAATAFYSPASSGLVPETVPAGMLQQANGYMSVFAVPRLPARRGDRRNNRGDGRRGLGARVRRGDLRNERPSPDADAPRQEPRARELARVRAPAKGGLGCLHRAHLGLARHGLDLALFHDHLRAVLHPWALRLEERLRRGRVVGGHRHRRRSRCPHGRSRRVARAPCAVAGRDRRRSSP